MQFKNELKSQVEREGRGEKESPLWCNGRWSGGFSVSQGWAPSANAYWPEVARVAKPVASLKVEGQQLPEHWSSHKSWGAEAILGFGIVLAQCQCRIEQIA